MKSRRTCLRTRFLLKKETVRQYVQSQLVVMNELEKNNKHVRTIKSDEEIALIKHETQIGEMGSAACVEAIAEGVPEHKAALHSVQAIVREIAHRYQKINTEKSSFRAAFFMSSAGTLEKYWQLNRRKIWMKY